MSDQSPFLAPSDDIVVLRQQYKDALAAYEKTKAYADWTIMCEAQMRYIRAKHGPGVIA